MVNLPYLIQLINNWQALIGSLIIAIITLISVAIILYKLILEQKRRKKEQYNRLLAIVYELKMIIKRCEGYLYFWKENKKHYNKIIIHDFNNQLAQAQLSDINPKIYNSIKKIYSITEVIMDNFIRSEVLNSTIGELNINKIKNAHLNWMNEKKEDIQIPLKNVSQTYLQLSDIDSRRYSVAISFIVHYLEDLYKNFNFICFGVQRYAVKNKFEFPNDIKRYTQKYVVDMVRDYNLDCGKLDGY